MKFKHYTDHDHRRGFFRRMAERIRCDYPLSICQRMKYPFFCIIVLNDKNIPSNAKREFIENFVEPYINSQQFILDCGYKKPSLFRMFGI